LLAANDRVVDVAAEPSKSTSIQLGVFGEIDFAHSPAPSFAIIRASKKAFF
jgi:hypothetical protein